MSRKIRMAGGLFYAIFIQLPFLLCLRQRSKLGLFLEKEGDMLLSLLLNLLMFPINLVLGLFYSLFGGLF
jgi:hypothetical protein